MVTQEHILLFYRKVKKVKNLDTPRIEQEELKKMEAEAKAILARIAKSSPEDFKVALATLKGMAMALED